MSGNGTVEFRELGGHLAEMRQEKADKNREYQRAYYHEKRKNNPVYRKKHKRTNSFNARARKYKISAEDQQILYAKQNGRCATCGRHQPLHGDRGNKVMCVDHSHKNGKVRGMLCAKCNSVLGYVKDDIRVLESMIAYLKEHE